jgi:hypothetical protein
VVVPQVMHATRSFIGVSGVQIGGILRAGEGGAAPCVTHETREYGQNTDNPGIASEVPWLRRGSGGFSNFLGSGVR